VKGVAFLFPGNRSVRVGMLAGLADEYPELLAPLEQASDRLGTDLWALARDGPEEELLSDPAASLSALAVDVGMFRLLEGMGIAPIALAGYGAGYAAAVVAAGVVSLEIALEVACEEQRSGQEGLEGREYGLVEVVGLTAGEVEDILGDLVRGDVVCLAAQDAPTRCTLAAEVGPLRTAVDRLTERAERIEPLPRTLPRHTPVMRPVAERLNASFGKLDVEEPRTPIYSHFDGSVVLRGWQAKELMIKEILYPLRWDQCVRGLVRNGMDTFVEVGPGTRLSELVRSIEPTAETFDTDSPAAIQRVRASFSSWSF